MKLKAFTFLIIILLIASCLFSGCLGGDKIVGTWQSKEDPDDTITFHKNGTYNIGGKTEYGKWEKYNGEYILSSDTGVQLMKARFVGKDLRVTVNLLFINVDIDYEKIK